MTIEFCRETESKKPVISVGEWEFKYAAYFNPTEQELKQLVSDITAYLKERETQTVSAPVK